MKTTRVKQRQAGSDKSLNHLESLNRGKNARLALSATNAAAAAAAASGQTRELRDAEADLWASGVYLRKGRQLSTWSSTGGFKQAGCCWVRQMRASTASDCPLCLFTVPL